MRLKVRLWMCSWRQDRFAPCHQRERDLSRIRVSLRGTAGNNKCSGIRCLFAAASWPDKITFITATEQLIRRSVERSASSVSNTHQTALEAFLVWVSAFWPRDTSPLVSFVLQVQFLPLFGFITSICSFSAVRVLDCSAADGFFVLSNQDRHVLKVTDVSSWFSFLYIYVCVQSSVTEASENAF